jgi:hypothetical protein
MEIRIVVPSQAGQKVSEMSISTSQMGMVAASVIPAMQEAIDRSIVS